MQKMYMELQQTAKKARETADCVFTLIFIYYL